MADYTALSFDRVHITGGFWKRRQEINRAVTAQAVYDRFSDTHRFDALSCRWHDGMEYKPHIFWDSDVAKWIEGVAYLLAEERDEHLEALCDEAIAQILGNQAADGYFNSYYLAVAPDERFTERENHELYCAGHLIEAACAYFQATGKGEFLAAMRRYADLIYRIFYVERSAAFATPGHPEIELALFKLADVTGEEKYAELAKYFLDARGNNEKDIANPAWGAPYNQSHKPLKDQTAAAGHAVRAGYIYSAMADEASHFSDAEYGAACERLFENITERQMYITGGVGSTNIGEAFTGDWDLPNLTSYAETCAAISMVFFARRMLKLRPDSRYADTVERIMYNGALSGVSLDGKKFFYSNAMEIDPHLYAHGGRAYLQSTERAEVFDCSCCPPNVLRFIASVSDSFYTYRGDTLIVHQFAESSADILGAAVTQETSYPADGEVKIRVSGKFRTAAIRVPGWCSSFALSVPYMLKDGYAYVDLPESGEVTVKFDMSPQMVEANVNVRENTGKASLMYGPIVYCMEGKDNGGDLQSLFLTEDASFTTEPSDVLGVPIIKAKGFRRRSCEGLYAPLSSQFEPVGMTFIPYFAYANRGVDEMTVWTKVLPKYDHAD